MTTKPLTESVWHDSLTDSMVLNDPRQGKGPHKVDDAQAAAEFWNANKNADLRDPYNGHYWSTATARAEFIKYSRPVAVVAQAPLATPAPSVGLKSTPTAVQLWEPCDKCGAEPSYQTASGHVCKNCQH